MPAFFRTGVKSRLALAIALATGAALTVSAPAYAQKKQEKTAERKASHSKAFVGVFKGIEAAAKADDFATLKPAIPALLAAAETGDDKLVAGQLAYRVGLKTEDTAMERQGLEMMLASGVADAKSVGQINYALAQHAFTAKDYDRARSYAQAAISAGFAEGDLLIAETYFSQDQAAAGLASLDKAVAAKVAAGEAVPESWLKRGLANAYQANLEAQALKYGAMYAQYYPSATSWGDAINVQRNLRSYETQETLDLLRLAKRVNALRTERDYVDYISAVDARRFPGETQQIIAAGIAAGLLSRNDVFVTEASSAASSRVKADEADLPNLARDARAASATASTLTAAGDAFLSYGKAAEAEEFYTKALTKPGVDTARVLTRLGIAQLDLGKTAEAQANFARVEGARQAIAGLWSLYAAQASKTAQPAS